MPRLALLAAAGFALARSSTAAQVNPVEKVVELLTSLTSKVVLEGETEQKQYEDFAEWCSDTAKEKQYEIKTSKDEIGDLEATIEKASSDISRFHTRIDELSTSMATSEGDLASATKIRNREAEDYQTERNELTETMDTLSRAIGLLKRTLGGSLLQTEQVNKVMGALKTVLAASVFSTNDKRQLAALVQVQSDDDSEDSFLEAPAGAPAGKVYESKSGVIVETLENMLTKAEGMRSESEKSETKARHNFALLKQSLEQSVANDNKEMDASKKALAAAEQQKATAEGDLEVAQKTLAEDEEYLEKTHADCMAKATSWETSQASRQAELTALEQAKKIIVKMTSGATDRSYALLQVATSSQSRRLRNVVQALKQLGLSMHDEVLVQLGFRARVASRSQDPFAKVKGLIQSMIEKLIADAQKEADHKAYCDKEIAETKAKIEDKNEAIDKLSAKIDRSSATVAKLSEDIATLQSELAALAKSQLHMDEMRHNENEEFVVVEKELTQGVEGIRMALKVLRDYYASGKGEEALVQQPATSSHSANGGAGGGIIAMLEVIEADFSRNLADAQVTEKAAQEEYDTMTQENKVTKVTKSQDVKYKTQEKKSNMASVSEWNQDRDGEQTELDAVHEYYESIKMQCIAKPESYAERKQRRETEIAGLKNALEILEGEAMGFLQRN